MLNFAILGPGRFAAARLVNALNRAGNTKLIAVIGKLAAGRGFEDAMRTFALVHQVNASARLMIIGCRT